MKDVTRAVFFTTLFAASSLTSALAEDAPADQGAVSDSSQLEEITVTARRREESISKVPISISALSASDLQDKEIVTETDLQAAVPGLTVRATQQQNQLTYSVRGQSVDSLSGSVPAVLPYLDEVQLNTQTASTFFDLENIQVLKGPQGTLFGRNTTGGAVLYTTAKPSNDFGGYAEIDLGNYSLERFQSAVNLPIISDKLLLRIALISDNENGYVKDVFNGETLGTTNSQSGRISLIGRPIDGLETSLVYQYSRNDGTNLGGTLYSVYPCGAPNVGVPTACIYGPAIAGALNASNPKVYPGGLNAFYNYQKNGLGFYTEDSASPAEHVSHTNFLTDTTTFDISRDAQIKNIFGYATSVDEDQNGLIGSPYEAYVLGQAGNAYGTTQYSDELHLSGKTLGDRLSYIGGVYYSYERDESDLTVCLLCDLGPFGLGPIKEGYHYQTTDQSEAAYAQASYAITSSGLSVTAGFRETRETITLDRLAGDVFGGPSQSTAEDKPSWTIGLDYQVSAQWLLYLTQRGSWRTGGFNGTSSPADDEFQPETTRDVELGTKYSGEILGHSARVNLAVYDQWIDKAQRDLYLFSHTAAGVAFSFYTGNVPTANVRGLDLDGEVVLTSWLKAGMALAYLDARYTSPVVTIPTYSPVTFGPYGSAPRWTASEFLEVTLPTPRNLGNLTIRADAYEQSDYYFSNLNSTLTPGTLLPSYSTIDGRFDWHSILGSKLGAALFVKNAAGRQYYLGGLATGAILGLNTAIPAPPRTYGASIRYDF
jgi:iron complex outermembrane receptor protein